MNTKRLASRSLLAVAAVALLSVCVWMGLGLFGCAQQERIEDARDVLVDPDATELEREEAWEEIREAEGQIDTIAAAAGTAASPLVPPPFNLLAAGVAGVIAALVKGRSPE